MPLSEKELLITMINKQKEIERRNRENNSNYYTCKTCGYTFQGKVNYCPNCGIKLKYI